MGTHPTTVVPWPNASTKKPQNVCHLLRTFDELLLVCFALFKISNPTPGSVGAELSGPHSGSSPPPDIGLSQNEFMGLKKKKKNLLKSKIASEKNACNSPN